MGDRTNDLSLQDVLTDRPVLKRALAVGMEGLDVARLQAELRRLDLPAGTIDGVFGDKTGAAVQALCTRLTLPWSGSVDAAIWAAVGQAVAVEQARTLSARATAHENLATLIHNTAAAAQQVARDKRAQNTAAGEDEEKAGEGLLQAGRIWLEAAQAWLAAAGRMAAPHEGYAKHLRALEQARDHGVKASASFAQAGKDYTAAGVSGHESRLATATITARDLAASGD